MRDRKVLVIEDNLMNMEMICDWLTAHACVVLQAYNAPDGIRMALDDQPDIVLMDIALPGMDGVEATRTLKSDERTAGIPVLAVTASSMRVNLENLHDIGCAGVVYKPFDFNELEQKMDAALTEAGAEEDSL